MYRVLVDDAKLSEIVRRLVEALDPDRIILFGSRARGDFGPQSDLDLLIVKPSAEPKHRRAGKAHRALIGVQVPIDILWCTPEEIESRSGMENYVGTRAMREGRLLYARTN